MRTLAPVLVTLVALGFPPSALHGQQRISLVDVDVGGGVTFASDRLGSVYPISPHAGYLELGEIDRWPSVGLGVAFPALWAGIRPTARVSYAFAAGVDAQWIPCNPGWACPAILLEPKVRVSRLVALAGVEIPLPVEVGPVHPHATLAVGARRYDVQWQALGQRPGDTFVLPEDSRAETDVLWRVGGGASAGLGWNLRLWGQVDVDMSRFGPGVVPVRPQVAPVEHTPEFDLGRETRRETTLTLGIRRSF